MVFNVIFNPCEREKYISGLWQYDYGHILAISGLELPKTVKIEFSLEDKVGTTIPRMGTTEDGVTKVTIPNNLLANEGCHSGYRIYVFVYVEDGEQGYTYRKITLSVKSRPKPGEYDPPDEEPDYVVAQTRQNAEDIQKIKEEMVTEDTLTEKVEEALTEAKESGQFDGADGAAGASAYEVAVESGFEGTVTEWLASLVGTKGEKGEAGEKGATGEDGADGKSAYELAVANGFEGTEQEWLDSLVGAEGPQGPQGETGAQGPQGERGEAGPQGAKGDKGEQGIQGEKGDTGETGPKGDKGDTGAQGPQGEQGPAGADGKDGANGTAGVDGVSVVKVEQTTTSTEDGGTNVITVTLSNGKTFSFNVKNGSKGSDGDSGTGSSGVSSWNDLTDKPFYSEIASVEILPLQTLTIPYSSDAMLYETYMESEKGFAAGEEVTVSWNSVEYVCTAESVSGIAAVGNVGLMAGSGDTGEPFLIGYMDGQLIIDCLEVEETPLEAKDITLSIISKQETVVKMPKKYLEAIDYDCNDANSAAHILNRPFYKLPTGTEVFAETNIALQDYGEAYGGAATMPNGMTSVLLNNVVYTATLNGAAYSLTCAQAESDDFGGVYYMFNGTDVPFSIIVIPAMGMFAVDDIPKELCTGAECTFSLALGQDYYKKLEANFLPESAGGGGLPEVTTDDNDKILQVVDGAWKVLAIADSAVKTYIDDYINEALGGDY